jgi:7,8-dihydropterin-6-yl-methyl-4-(beta-D-ribofuranosyl)aminobenzene 5'-phosphate synthase
MQGDLWGFAAYLPQHHLLFDTGSNGRRLLRNMADQGIDPMQIEHLFISHDHWDHIGGIDSVLELNPDVTVWAPYTLSRNHLRDLRTLAREVVVINRNEPRHLFGNLYSTGMLGGTVPEHSLIIASDNSIVLTGCGHYGIGRITDRAANVIHRPIHCAVGGFHLLDSNEMRIHDEIAALRQQGIKCVLPTHCTGEKAMELFAEAFGVNYLAGGVGSRMGG